MAKSRKNSCKGSISDRCPGTMNSACVDYDSDIYLENTSLDPDDCNTVEDLIEDIIVAVDQNTQDLNFEDFGCCLEYEASDEERGLTLKDVLSAHESKICELLDGNVGEGSGGNCEGGCGDTDPCSDNYVGAILQSNSSVTSQIVMNNMDWVISNNSSLSFKANKIGTYEVILEFVESSNVLQNQNATIGIAVDNTNPEPGIFTQTTISPRHPKTVHFFTKLIPNGVVKVAYKTNVGTYRLDYIKMIVKKVK